MYHFSSRNFSDRFRVSECTDRKRERGNTYRLLHLNRNTIKVQFWTTSFFPTHSHNCCSGYQGWKAAGQVWFGVLYSPTCNGRGSYNTTWYLLHPLSGPRFSFFLQKSFYCLMLQIGWRRKRRGGAGGGDGNLTTATIYTRFFSLLLSLTVQFRQPENASLSLELGNRRKKPSRAREYLRICTRRWPFCFWTVDILLFLPETVLSSCWIKCWVVVCLWRTFLSCFD